MRDYADLEIGLHHWDRDLYNVELRFSQAGSDTETRLLQDSPLVRFDFAKLEQLSLDPGPYGRLLRAILFRSRALRTAFASARQNAQAARVPLRVRLFISPNASRLHQLRWETLRDPQDRSSTLATSQQIYFSRYLVSLDFRPVGPRSPDSLKALVVVANPSDLSHWRPGGRTLAPVDVPGELERAESGLRGIRIAALPDPRTDATETNATLNNLVDGLGDREEIDILYLVCHGALLQGEPLIWLENAGGGVDVVRGGELVARLKELKHLPRLVVLASCQSFGTGDDARANDQGALAALGPRLAEAGVPAVLAMQGDVTLQTVGRFLPRFFEELCRDGRIDRAVAIARGQVRDRPDAWMPVLIMRLKTGRLWDRGGAVAAQQFEPWDALLSNIAAGRCTPILGSGVVESWLGSSRETARRWAEAYHFPMAPQDREDLPQVAQYLAITQDRSFPRAELVRYLRREILRRQRGLPDALKREKDLDALIKAVGALERGRNAAEPHAVLASLRCPLYITANADGLMADALAVAGRQPQVGWFDWKLGPDAADPGPDPQSKHRPDPQHPLVYHLFGRLADPASLALTEDDYFDYLIAMTRNDRAIPNFIHRALTDTSLLFIGFQLDDWSFRTLFRSIVSQPGSYRRKDYIQVAVQVDPKGDQTLEPELARRYLEKYFKDAAFQIYWANVEDFMAELKHRWEGYRAANE